MGSDRARRSFDADRMYRSVVSQQGRVTVEADANEAEEIRTAEARADLIDVIGPSGSPDDGFKISVPATTGQPRDFAIAAGTIYVGGVRVESTDRAPSFSAQARTEWLDAAPPVPSPSIYEWVYLTIAEQEVSAVEDPALREVALGGPDTAARTRMIQRVERTPFDGVTCESALRQVAGRLWGAAQHLDPATMRLASTARLKVGFVQPTGAADPCQPIAQAGFLGAENQLVRVQVSSDPAWFLWGYDNASFLYRVTVNPADTASLTLGASPVDVFHQPRVGQWVEVLASAVGLGDDAFVAAPVGFAAKVADYDPGGPTVTLDATLPPELLARVASTDDLPKQVFLRVWENRQQFPADADTDIELASADGHGTGVQIAADGSRVPGDHWLIGVRPSQPDAIFPARLHDFQPPDGPARWVVPLAVIKWSADRTTAEVSDCRHRFKNLVELTEEECGCELLLSPGDDVAKRIEERQAANRDRAITGLHLRFGSGVFTFDQPLVVTATGPGDLTVSGCGSSTQLRSTTQEVVLVARGWNSATVVDLSIEAGVAGPGHGKKHRPDAFPPAAGDELRHLGGALTLLDCTSVRVERVVAASAALGRRAASCLTVRHRERGSARIRGCDFWPGADQIGVLLVNVERATVEDNRIRLNPKAQRPDDATIYERVLVDGLHVGAKGPARPMLGRAMVDLTARSGVAMRFATHSALAAPWRAALASLERGPITPVGVAPPPPPDKPPTRKDAQLLARRVAAIAKQAIDPRRGGPLAAAELAPLRDFAVKARAELPLAIGQGIVVGGALAGDLRLADNTIVDAIDGIHVGVSVRGAPHRTRGRAARPEPIRAARVQIVGNTISQRIPLGESGIHCGIFVGNVDVATVRDNQVDVQSDEWSRAGEAIRVWGQLGPMLLVTGNTCRDGEVGIRVHAVPHSAQIEERLWRVTQNLVQANGNVGLEIRPFVDAGDNVVIP